MATRCKHGMIQEQCSICRQTYARYEGRSRAEADGSASVKSKERDKNK